MDGWDLCFGESFLDGERSSETNEGLAVGSNGGTGVGKLHALRAAPWFCRLLGVDGGMVVPEISSPVRASWRNS